MQGYFLDKIPIFCFDTWLSNPQNKTILGGKSSIASLIDDFKIVKTYLYLDKRNLWRNFGADTDKPINNLPRNTSLQSKMADWLLEGNMLGAGKGVFLYDTVNRTRLK